MLVDNIEALVRHQRFNTQDVVFGGNTPPNNPVDGMMWYENPIGSSPYPQPWYYNSSNAIWLSTPFFYDFGSAIFSTSSFIEKSVPFYGVTNNRILVRQIVGLVTNQGSTAHSSANQYTFAIRHTTGTGTPLPETNSYTLLTNTGDNPSALGGNASRRILENPNVFLPGNAWSLRFNVTRVGTPPNIFAHFGSWLQFAR